MNYSKPMLICDESESFRSLIKEMLIKNGFFHIMDAATAEEALVLLRAENDFFVLTSAHLVSVELINTLHSLKSYVIFADKTEASTLSLAARLGTDHIISYPFHSQKLLDKIHSFI